jgi:hypothetical protein
MLNVGMIRVLATCYVAGVLTACARHDVSGPLKEFLRSAPEIKIRLTFFAVATFCLRTGRAQRSGARWR